MGTAAWYELMQGLAYLGDMLDKMWAILTASPQSFKGGAIWKAITTINGALGAIGTALLVLFFTVGVIKTCGSFAELKKPETTVKVFVRFVLAKYLINNCLKLMVNFVTIVQSVISKIAKSSKIGTALEFSIPSKVYSRRSYVQTHPFRRACLFKTIREREIPCVERAETVQGCVN